MGEIGIFDEPRQEWIQFDEDTEVLMEFMPKDELKKMTQEAEKIARKTRQDVNEILGPRVVKRVVKNWRKIDAEGRPAVPEHPGFTIGGKPLEFNVENALMLHARSYEFFHFIQEYASNARYFIEAEKARAAKNSKSSPVPTGAEASL
jgi:hypothetical protein